MANETNTNIETTAPDNGYQEYIDTINELKRNTVSREMFDKEREEKKALLSSLVNGTGSVVADEPAKRETTAEIINRAFYAPNSLEAAKGYMALRERLMEDGGDDPFVGMANPHFKNTGKEYTPTAVDFAEAARYAEAIQYCIDKADGSNEAFEKEIRRIIR